MNDLEGLLNNQKLSLAIDTVVTDNDVAGLLLPGTQAVSEVIDKCWSDRVFIHSLAHQFWKMTLQVRQRHIRSTPI